MCWAQIAGVGVGAGQSAMQGQQDADTLNRNAILMDMKAEDATKRGGVAEENQRTATRQQIGDIRATVGASGVDVNTGSAVDLQTQTAKIGEQDAQQIRANALSEAWGYRTEAAGLRAQAENAMGMADLLMPGGKKYQERIIKNFSLKGAGGLYGMGNTKSDLLSYDKSRLPWK